MTPEQLDAIETDLGFPLPVEYRRVAVARPFWPIGSGDHIYRFFDDPDWVVGETLAPQSASGRDVPRLPFGSMAIGFSACGDTYVLDTRAEGQPVHCLSHETREIEPEYPSFAAFVTEWLEAPERVRAELEARDAAARAEYRTMMRRAWRIIFLGFLVVLVLPFLSLAVIVWFNERRRRRGGPGRR